MTLTVLASPKKAKKPLSVDIILPLSGVQQSGGTSMQQGFELAQAELLEQGEDLRLVFFDSESKKNRAATLAKELSEAKGSENKTVMLAADELSLGEARKHLDRNRVPYLVPMVEEKKLLKQMKMGQGFSQTLAGKISVAGQFSMKELSAKKVLLFLPLDNGRIEEFLAEAKSVLGKKAKLVVESYKESEEISLLSAKVFEHKADVNWVPWMSAERLQVLIRESRDLGWSRPFLGFEDWDGVQLSEGLGEAWIGNFLIKHYHYSFDSKLNRKFVQNFSQRFSGKPSELSALAYESLHFAFEAFKKSAYRGKGLSLLKMYRRFGRYKGLVGNYRVRQNAPLQRPLLVLRSAPGGYRVEATYTP